MKRLFTAAVLALCLAGCTSFSADTATDGKRAVQAALVAYTGIYQPAVIEYGRLPDCPATPLCRDRALFAKLAAADQVVRTSANVANPVLHGDVPNTGQLTALINAITNAQTQVARAGILPKE